MPASLILVIRAPKSFSPWLMGSSITSRTPRSFSRFPNSSARPLPNDQRGGDRGAGAEVPVDEGRPLPGELLGALHRQLRVTGIVGGQEGELLAVDAALGVDVPHRHVGA